LGKHAGLFHAAACVVALANYRRTQPVSETARTNQLSACFPAMRPFQPAISTTFTTIHEGFTMGHRVISATTERALERSIVALLDSYHISSLRNVRVQARDGVITVSGEVNTFYAKQVLQHAVQRFGDGYQLDNQVRVSTALPLGVLRRPVERHAVSLQVSATPIATSIANSQVTEPVTISH
jgi:hypothetical protein